MQPQSPLLADRWQLVERIGGGAMGEVWRGRHVVLEHDVAIKLMRPETARDKDLVARFLREARIAARLRHKNVARVEDFGASPAGLPFLVMEYLRGASLEAELERRGRFDPAMVALVAQHVGAACDVAHAAGIVHRDLKPDNCFVLTEDDGSVLVKVLDFGVAKVTDNFFVTSAGVVTASHALLGTPLYMSPEQAAGKSDLDGRSDLWSLGVILYEMMTGRAPFDTTSLTQLLLSILQGPIALPSSFEPSLPPAVDAWAARALERDRALRFQSGRELAVTLAQALGVAPASASLPPGESVRVSAAGLAVSARASGHGALASSSLSPPPRERTMMLPEHNATAASGSLPPTMLSPGAVVASMPQYVYAPAAPTPAGGTARTYGMPQVQGALASSLLSPTPVPARAIPATNILPAFPPPVPQYHVPSSPAVSAVPSVAAPRPVRHARAAEPLPPPERTSVWTVLAGVALGLVLVLLGALVQHRAHARAMRRRRHAEAQMVSAWSQPAPVAPAWPAPGPAAIPNTPLPVAPVPGPAPVPAAPAAVIPEVPAVVVPVAPVSAPPAAPASTAPQAVRTPRPAPARPARWQARPRAPALPYGPVGFEPIEQEPFPAAM